MKEKLKYLMIITFLIIFGTTCVKAEKVDISKDDIEGNTYVIGTHMFTSETELTTKMIMLASKTIESDDLSDMIIYYKDPFDSTWIDALSGEEVDMNNNISITHINLNQVDELIDPNAHTPVLHSVTPYFEENPSIKGITINVGYYELGEEDSVEYKIYNSDSKNGEYTLLEGNIEIAGDWGNDEECGPAYFIAVDDMKALGSYFKVKAIYNINGKTMNSDLSNEVEILADSPNLIDAYLTAWSGTDYTTKGINVTFTPPYDIIYKGIEVYTSNSKDGEYTLLEGNLEFAGDCVWTEKNGFCTAQNLSIEDMSNLGDFIKIKAKYNIDGKIIYSDFTNSVEVSAYAPELIDVHMFDSNDPNYKALINFNIDRLRYSLEMIDIELQLYSSTSENGEYKLLEGDIGWGGDTSFGECFGLRLKETNNVGMYFKLRVKYTIDGKVIYSDYSNVVELSE